VRIANEPKPPAHLWSVTLAEKSEKRWTSADAYGVDEFAISPDSAHVALHSASTGRHVNPVTEETSEIYTIDLKTGEVRRITENNVREGMPRFSPDSQWLVFTAPDDFTEMRNEKLYLYPVAGGPLRKLLPDWDHNAGSPTWSADSKTLYFTEGIGVVADSRE